LDCQEKPIWGIPCRGTRIIIGGPKWSQKLFRMDMATFNELLEMVTPIIKRRDTLMRDSISM
jgi:hypothetical protein